MSDHAKLSPSAAHRWMRCTASATLESGFPYTSSPYAEEGTFAHRVCELLARKAFTTIKPSDYKKQLASLKKDKLWADEMLKTAETYAEHLKQHYYRLNTPAVSLEVRVNLTAYIPDGFGTCDCVIIGNGELIVTDYKHGKGVPVAAESNEQMMLYALGALSQYYPLYGNSLKTVKFYIDQPRLDSYSGYEMTVAELLEWGEKVVKPTAAIAAGGQGEFMAGEHCQFCRAAAICRHRAGACTALEDFASAIPEGAANEQQKLQAEAALSFGVKPSQPLLTDEEIGDLLTRGSILVKWYKSLEDYALQACLSGRRIPGYKAVEGRSSRAWSDQDAALAVILGAGYAEAMVYDRVAKSLAQLEKAIGKKDFEKLVGGYVIKPPGKPTLEPESDKRPPYNAAIVDFAGQQ